MHQQAYNFVRRHCADLPDGPVLEIGSLNINGSIRDLFPGRTYLGIDRVSGPDVDVVATGATYTPDTPPAIVVCCEVLEHTDEAEAICHNTHRILTPGGVFIVTAAGDSRAPHSAVDGGPIRQGEYYQNISAADLSLWLFPFATAVVETDLAAGDVYAVARKAV